MHHLCRRHLFIYLFTFSIMSITNNLFLSKIEMIYTFLYTIINVEEEFQSALSRFPNQ